MLDPYKIHLNQSDWDTSDSGNSDLDEDYYRFQPPPLVILPQNIIVIEASTNPRNVNNIQASYCDGPLNDVKAKKKKGKNPEDVKAKKKEKNPVDVKAKKKEKNPEDVKAKKKEKISKDVKAKTKEKNPKATEGKKIKLNKKDNTSKNVIVEKFNTKSVELPISTQNQFNALETSEDESVKTSDNIGEKYSETEHSHKKIESLSNDIDKKLKEENVFIDIETEDPFIQISKKKQKTKKRDVQVKILDDDEGSTNMNILQNIGNEPNPKKSNNQNEKGKDSDRVSQTSKHDEKTKKSNPFYNALNITYDQGKSQTSKHDEKTKKSNPFYNALNITYDQGEFIYSQTKQDVHEKNKRQPNLQGTQCNEGGKDNKQNTIYSFYKYSNSDFKIYNGPLIGDVQTEDTNIQNERDSTELSVSKSMLEAAKNVEVNTVVDMTQKSQHTMSQSRSTNFKYEEGKPSHNLFFPEFKQTNLSHYKPLDYAENNNELVAKLISVSNSSTVEEQDRLYVEQIYNQTILEMPLKKKKKKGKNKTAPICNEYLNLVTSEDQTIMLPITYDEYTNRNTHKTSDISNENQIMHELEEVHHYPIETNVTQSDTIYCSMIGKGQIESLKNINQKATSSIKYDNKTNQCPNEYTSKKLSFPEKTNQLYVINDSDTFCSKAITDQNPIDKSLMNRNKKPKELICSEENLNVVGVIPKPNGHNLLDFNVASMSNCTDQSKLVAEQKSYGNVNVHLSESIEKTISQSNLTKGKPNNNLSYPELIQTYLSNHKLLDYGQNNMVTETYSFNNSSSLEKIEQLYVEPTSNQSTQENPLKKIKKTKKKKTTLICDEDLQLVTSRDQTIIYTNDEATNKNALTQGDETFHETSDIVDMIKFLGIKTWKNYIQKATSSTKCDNETIQRLLECPSQSYENLSNEQLVSLLEIVNHVLYNDGDSINSDTITNQNPIDKSQKNKNKKRSELKKPISDEEQICDRNQINDQKATSSKYNKTGLVVNICSGKFKQTISSNNRNKMKCICEEDNSDVIVSSEYEAANTFMRQHEADHSHCSKNVEILYKPPIKDKQDVGNIQKKSIFPFHQHPTNFNNTPKWGRKCQSVSNICQELDLEMKSWIPIGNNPTHCIKENKQEMSQKPQNEAEIVSDTIKLYEAAENAHHSVPKKTSILGHCLNSIPNIPPLIVMGSFVLWVMYLLKKK